MGKISFLFFLVVIFLSNPCFSNTGILSQVGEATNIIRNFPYGSSSSNSNSNDCADCSASGFKESRCPRFASSMISDHIVYGGILGFMNNEKKFDRCFENVFQENKLNLHRFSSLTGNYFHISSMPAISDYQQCFEEYNLHKKTKFQKEKILFALYAVEAYKACSISQYRKSIEDLIERIENQDTSKSTYEKKLLKRIRKNHYSIVSMESCFQSGINCFGAGFTYQKVPDYQVNELMKDSRVPGIERGQLQKYLDAAHCILH